MLAFFGTAALPHILIRYYTVSSQRDARKSTLVAIGGIGVFYLLTLFMGLGAITLGVMDVADGIGMISALGIILTSPSMFVQYGRAATDALHGLDNPGIISIPLSFVALIVVSLLTQKENRGLREKA